MKKILIVISFLLIASAAYALEAPHDDTNRISCFDCHTSLAVPPPDSRCLVCHINATGGGYSKTNAPRVKTHSSATTSDKYGTWTIQCRDCHIVHSQQQREFFFSATHLVTGTVATVTDNSDGTTTIGYTNAVEKRTGWADFTKWGRKSTNERGLILTFPALGSFSTSVNFEIISATATTMRLTGSVNLAYGAGAINPGDQFVLMYGQNVAFKVVTPAGTLSDTVRFFDNKGPNSFAYSEAGAPTDPAPDGVCQVCHTKTTHWRKDGTLAAIGVHAGVNGGNCMVCHPHAEGFSAAGACNSCHGFPPINNSLGGPDGLVVNEGGTGSNSPGGHSKHATAAGLNYSCETCHTGGMPASPIYDKITQLGFNAFGIYQTGSYDGRSASANGYTYGTGNAGTTITLGGTQSCSNIYCHSVVQTSGGGALAPNSAGFKKPSWTGVVQCGDCHAADGVQGNKSLMISGSHGPHVNADIKKACNECHNGFGSGSAAHVNNEINLAFLTDPFGKTGVYSQSPNTPGNGYGSCSTVYCHSIGQREGGAALVAGTTDYKNPTWGGTSLCGSCHAINMQTGSHTRHLNYPFDCITCHNNAGPGTTLHADANIDVSFNGTYGPSAAYSQNPNTPGNGYGTCSSVYCHSNSKVDDAGSGVGQYATPLWGESLGCKSCHGSSGTSKFGEPDYASGAGGGVDANSHAKHVNALKDCANCHSQTADASGNILLGNGKHVNKIKEVNLAAGGSYNSTNKQCSSTLCHGSGTPQWGAAGSVVCGSCHAVNNTIAGSHSAHYAVSANATSLSAANNSTQTDYIFNCGVCHNTISHGSGPVNASRTAEVDFDALIAGGGAYTQGSPQGTDPVTGFNWTAGSCSSTYCHSQGTRTAAPYAAPGTQPVWGGNLGCAGCHTGGTATGPTYANGSPKANSHQAHVVNFNAPCNNCHNSTTSNGTTITNKANHANKVYNLQASGGSVTFTATAGTPSTPSSCSSISCHGGNNATWGGSLNCQDCHLSALDLDDFAGTFYTNGTTATVSSGEWTATGHGRASGNYTSGNPAAGFTTSNACLYCHDDTIAHKTAANPFRLKNFAAATWGKNGNCQACHAEGSTGVTVDSTHKNGTKKVGSTHYGTKHNVTASGGQFCWDCHDPHGDQNIFMVHAKVAKTSDVNTGAPLALVNASFTAFATGTDYAGGANSTKICNTCHTSVNHYTSTTSDTHNATIRCTQCHKHTGDLLTDAFKPSGENCFDCHSSAGGPIPGTAPDAYHAKHVQTAYVGKVSAGDYGNFATNQWYRQGNTGGVPDTGCGHCHPQASITHMDGKIDLNFSPTDTGAAGTLKAKNKATQTFTQNSRTNVVCASVYCHSDGYNGSSGYGYKPTPNWYGGTFSNDKCAGCHSNSPTGSTAHGAHVVGIHYNNIYTGTSGLATAGNTGTSSHGNGTTSTTINCNVCHNNTVTTAANDKGSACATCHSGSNLKGTMVIAASSTMHVNGMPDVAFAAIQVRSKAQLRNNIASVPELGNNWTRVGGYKVSGSYDMAKNALNTGTMYTSSTKTCSNISCHNGNQVTWSSSVSCNSCHTALPQ